MGHTIHINTSRMQCIPAYVAEPAGPPKAGIVVIQEIFGVNAHIREVADSFAAEGYTAIAPSFFDHLEAGVELGYSRADVNKGKALVAELGMELPLEDVASAAEAIASAGRIGTVGYCWGGTIALLSAMRLGLPSVSYYGARNVPFLHGKPRAPVMSHFGEKDSSIPPEMVEQHRQALPDMPLYTYPAGHAFNRAGGSAHHAQSAALARRRTLAFFEEQLVDRA